MALLKEFEFSNTGLSGTYSHISNITIFKDGQSVKASAILSLYKDKAARDSGKSPLSSVGIELGDAGLSEYLTALYNQIKQLPEFEGALDI